MEVKCVEERIHLSVCFFFYLHHKCLGDSYI